MWKNLKLAYCQAHPKLLNQDYFLVVQIHHNFLRVLAVGMFVPHSDLTIIIPRISQILQLYCQLS